MDTLQAIQERRAVKHYDPEHIMPEEDKAIIFKNALQSPTSFNIQHWRIVNVENEGLRQQIRAAAWDQAQVTEASMLLVLCADIKAWEKQPERYWVNAPEATQDMIVPMIGNFYQGQDQLQRDEAIRSIGIVSQTIMLSAKALGYDSCPMIGFDPEKVGSIIKLPDNHLVGMLLSIGKAIKPAWPRAGQLPQEEIVIQDTF